MGGEQKVPRDGITIVKGVQVPQASGLSPLAVSSLDRYYFHRNYGVLTRGNGWLGGGVPGYTRCMSALDKSEHRQPREVT